MKIRLFFIFLITILHLQNAFAFSLSSNPKDRSYIYIVGSSTVSPLIAAVSEEFSRLENAKGFKIITPIITATGSVRGFEAFCSGVGYKYPDFVNASRAIELSEIENCNKNGIKNIIEIKIGYDGIVLGNFVKAPKIKLTKEQIFLALAEKVLDSKTDKLIANPYEFWNQIDEKLPKTRIVIYGPPLTSGTRDVFSDMVLETACIHRKEFIAAYPDDASRKKQCHKIRNDDKFIESGENDDLIVEKLKNNPQAFGILGFNFIANNQKIIQAAEIDGVAANVANIASKKYPLSRPLFVYFKKEHLDLVPKVREFIAEIVNQETIGNHGYLVHNGLVPLNKAEFKMIQKNILSQLDKK